MSLYVRDLAPAVIRTFRVVVSHCFARWHHLLHQKRKKEKRKTDTLSLLSVFISTRCPMTFNGANYFDFVAYMCGLLPSIWVVMLFWLGCSYFSWRDPDIGFHVQDLNYGNQTLGNMWFLQTTNTEQRYRYYVRFRN